MTPGAVLTAVADQLDSRDDVVDWVDIAGLIGDVADAAVPDGTLRGKTVRMLAGHLNVPDLARWLPFTHPKGTAEVAATMRKAASGAVTR